MDTLSASKALAALSQETRLEAFRLLIRTGKEGLPAGDIARKLNIPHNTLSTHLSILSNAGLVSSYKEGRSVIYSVDFDGTRALMAFLMEDCCQGSTEICAPLLESILPQCCA